MKAKCRNCGWSGYDDNCEDVTDEKFENTGEIACPECGNTEIELSNDDFSPDGEDW